MSSRRTINIYSGLSRCSNLCIYEGDNKINLEYPLAKIIALPNRRRCSSRRSTHYEFLRFHDERNTRRKCYYLRNRNTSATSVKLHECRERMLLQLYSTYGFRKKLLRCAFTLAFCREFAFRMVTRMSVKAAPKLNSATNLVAKLAQLSPLRTRSRNAPCCANFRCRTFALFASLLLEAPRENCLASVCPPTFARLSASCRYQATLLCHESNALVTRCNARVLLGFSLAKPRSRES